MSTFYPTSSGQVDVLSTSYVQDQKFISYSESPMIHGNMLMYLPGAPSNGPFSEVVQNPVHIPSISGRNEMMFIPPTSDHISGAQSNTLVDGERNLNGLSLSLSTQLSTGVHQPASFDQFSNAGMSPLGMADGAFQNSMRFGAPNNLQDLVDLKPVGYNVNQYEEAGNGRVITKSRFLIVTQQLLDEIVRVQDAFKQHESGKDQTVKKVEDGTSDSNGKSVVASDVNETATASCPELSGSERQDLQNKLERLLAMLDEVDRRYKQYHHQMQILVSSFDYIAGSGAAKPYTTLASKTISRHFRSLRDGISSQIQSTRKTLGEQDSGQGGVIRRLRYVDQQLRQQRALQQFGMMRHSWRPQRGLPENAVTALRAWLFEHFLHPYPKDSEKIMLARQTGLTRSQVGNWFINARVRLWKPMVEEMYNEEFGEADLNLKSSPCRASEDRREELQERIRSMADQSGGHDESKMNVKDHTYEMNQTKLHDNQPSTSHGFYPHDQNVLIPFQVPELGSYGVNHNQVSLALGLRQIEGDVGTSLRPGSSSENVVGAGTAEYTYFGQVNQLQAHKFGNSNFLDDFVV